MDFATGDVDFSGSTAPGTLVGTVTGSGTTYNVAVSGMTGDGAVTVGIPAGVAHDAVDNPNEASTGADHTVAYDITAPVVSIHSLTTSSHAPALHGTADDPDAAISVTVATHAFAATNNGNGTWTLPENTITPSLQPGVYDVSVTATDLAGNVGTDSTTGELQILSTITGRHVFYNNSK